MCSLGVMKCVHDYQMWELNLDGTLQSSYSGLCAKIEAVEGDTRLDL